MIDSCGVGFRTWLQHCCLCRDAISYTCSHSSKQQIFLPFRDETGKKHQLVRSGSLHCVFAIVLITSPSIAYARLHCVLEEESQPLHVVGDVVHDAHVDRCVVRHRAVERAVDGAADDGRALACDAAVVKVDLRHRVILVSVESNESIANKEPEEILFNSHSPSLKSGMHLLTF